MSVISQLMVELGINTAAFSGGIDKATHQAKAFANDLKSQFSSVSAGVQGLVGQLGSINPVLSQVGSVASQAFSMITSSVGGAGGAMGAFVGVSLGVVGAAAAVAAGWALMAREGAEVVHSYEMMSYRTGIAISDLQALKAMGSTVDVDLGMLAMGFRRFSVALNGYSKDTSAAAHTLHALGISAHDPMEAFKQLAGKIHEMGDASQKAAVVTDLFGARMGTKLLPILEQGPAAIEKWIRANKEFGAVIDKDAKEKTQQYEEAVAKLGMQWERLKVRSLGALTYMIAGVNALLSVTNKLLSMPVSAMFAGIEGGSYGEGGGDKTRKDKQDAIDKENKAKQEAADAQGKVNDKLYQELQIAKEGSVAEAKLAEMKQRRGDLEKKIAESTGKAQQDALEEAKTLERQIPAQEHLAKLAKAGREYMLSLPEKKAKAIDAADIEIQKAYADMVKKTGEVTIAETAALEVEQKMLQLTNTAKEAGVKLSKAYKDAMEKTYTRAADISAEAKAVGDFNKMLEDETKKTQQHILALQEEATGTTEVHKALAKIDEALIPLNEKYKLLIAQMAEMRSKGAVPSEIEAKLKQEIVDTKALIDLKSKEKTETVESIQTKYLKDYNAQLVEAERAFKAIGGADPFPTVEEQLKAIATKVGPEVAEQLRDIVTRLHQIREETPATSGLAALMKGFGVDPAQNKLLQDELSLLESQRDKWMSSAQGVVAYRLAVAQLNKEIADMNAKTGGFGAGAKAAFADFNASMETSGEFMREVHRRGTQWYFEEPLGHDGEGKG